MCHLWHIQEKAGMVSHAIFCWEFKMNTEMSIGTHTLKTINELAEVSFKDSFPSQHKTTVSWALTTNLHPQTLFQPIWHNQKSFSTSILNCWTLLMKIPQLCRLKNCKVRVTKLRWTLISKINLFILDKLLCPWWFQLLPTYPPKLWFLPLSADDSIFWEN